MKYAEFKNEIVAELEDLGMEIEERQVTKNNGTVLDGITIKSSSNMCPTFYVNHMFDQYKEGKMIYDIVAEITKQVNATVSDFDVSSFTEWDKAKDNVTYYLMNRHANASFLASAPYVKYFDLAIGFRVIVDVGTNDNLASIKITNEHMHQWGVSVNDLLEVAKVNTPRIFPVKIKSMISMLIELGMPEEMAQQMGSDDPMTIITNTQNTNGAVSMLYDGVLEKIADEKESDLYIIPSSIHEVIVVPTSMISDPNDLTSMIGDVNRSEVATEERLGSHPYKYTRETKELTIA